MKRKLITVILSLLALLVVVQNVQAQSKDRLVVSPFYESDANGGVYTFIGITHPSLDTSTSQIGFKVVAQGGFSETSTTSTADNPSVEMTINAGNTHRLFIAATNGTISRAAVDPNGTEGSRLFFIITSSGTDSFGLLKASSSNLNPAVPNSSGKFNNLSQLNFWGAIVVLANTSGFAMEFIGDAHDSDILVGSDLTAPNIAHGVN